MKNRLLVGYTCHFATATPILVYVDMFTYYGHMYQEAKIEFWFLDDVWPDCVALMWLVSAHFSC